MAQGMPDTPASIQEEVGPSAPAPDDGSPTAQIAQPQDPGSPRAELPAPPATRAPTADEQRYQRLARAHRGLEIATAASLLLTGIGGTVALINQPTLLSDGRCVTGNPIFGDYGCNGFNLVHGLSGVTSAVLYTAERSVWLSMPKDQMERRMGPRRYAAYKALGYVHLVGMILQPVLGLIGAYPPILGLSPDPRSDFARAMKTVHVFNGYLIGASYLTTTILNF
jgi:hypothetical protein